MTLQLRLAEANPVSGGLRFELPEGGGSFAPGRRERKDRTRRGPITTKRRGRPTNIRHHGKRRRTRETGGGTRRGLISTAHSPYHGVSYRKMSSRARRVLVPAVSRQQHALAPASTCDIRGATGQP